MIIHKKNFPAHVPIGKVTFGTVVLWQEILYMVVDNGYSSSDPDNVIVTMYPLQPVNPDGRCRKIKCETEVIPVGIAEVTIVPWSLR